MLRHHKKDFTIKCLHKQRCDNTNLNPYWDFKTFLLRASQMALVIKNAPASAGDIGDLGSKPGSGRSPGEGHGNPL